MKLWILTTDTRNGTEIWTFPTEEAFDAHMHQFLAGYWMAETHGPMPEQWTEAWDGLDNTLCGLDTFQWDTFDLSAHPAMIAAREALALAEERLTMNNYGGEEDEFIAQITAAAARLEPPPSMPEQAA